jgi:hypothetical protein
VALTRPARPVIVAHNPVGEEDDPSTSDVLAQVGMVEGALASLGLPARRVAVEPREALKIFLGIAEETIVFNLIESPPGRPYLHTDCAAVMELAGLPFTGSSPAALALTTDKLATRALLASEGVAVAPGGRISIGRAFSTGSRRRGSSSPRSRTPRSVSRETRSATPARPRSNAAPLSQGASRGSRCSSKSICPAAS